jgi:hypothetical protein
VDELKVPMSWRVNPQCGQLAEDATYERHVQCRPLPDVQSKPTAVKIAIYHYISKSEEDFIMKVKRGGGGGKHRSWDEFDQLRRCDSYSSLL